MAEKPIIWSEQALQELEDILDYYNRRNQSKTQKCSNFPVAILSNYLRNKSRQN